MPNKKKKKNRKTSGKKGAATAVLDDDLYGDDSPNVTDISGDANEDTRHTKDNEQFCSSSSKDGKNSNSGTFDFDDITTEISTMTCGMDYHDKIKMMQKQAFQFRKDDQIERAKQLQNFIKERNREQRDAEEEMSKAMSTQFFQNMLGIPEEHRTDDGDQSPVYGHDKIAKLKWMWASAMNWEPNDPFSSPWLRCLAAGDYKEMMKLVEQTPPEKMEELLERRETLINVSALFHVIKGSTLLVKGENKFDLSKTFCNHSTSPRHVDCLKKLIELGANVHARDFAGFTPLHYSSTSVGNSTTFELSKLLLENGADPNVKNRLGETPLAEPIMTKKLECIRLLLNHGGDPTIKDNTGRSGFTSSLLDKNMMKLFYEARQKKARKMREEAKAEVGGILACEVCQKPSNRRCTGCYVARYCCEACQLSHWKLHKKACKGKRDRFILVNLKSLDVDCYRSLRDGKIWGKEGNALQKSKSIFLVKIQVTFEIFQSIKANFEPMLKPKMTSLLLYDKDKNVNGAIDPSEPAYQPLRDLIESKGLDRIKAYFLAIFDKDNKFRINIEDMQLPADW